MNTKLKTIDEVNTFIEKANTLLGYPNANGTETYCNVPEITEIKDENGNVTESFYELPVTNELNEILIKIATTKLITNEANTMV